MSKIEEQVAEIAIDWVSDDFVGSALIERLRQAGLAVVPVEPSPGLLASMAMRNDHSFGMPRQTLPGEMNIFTFGYTQEMREVAMRDMAKLYEEVVGTGFYSPEREDRYVKVAKEGGNL